jgi:hypothetical protein
MAIQTPTLSLLTYNQDTYPLFKKDTL